MKQEVYESLLNKTLDTMTGEDYKLYKAILDYRKAKKFRIFTAIFCYTLPFIVFPLMVGLVAGVQFLPYAFLFSTVFDASFSTIGVFSAFRSTNGVYKRSKKIVEENFNKEDLRILKRDGIFFMLKVRCEQFENSPRYLDYLQEELMKTRVGIPISTKLDTDEKIQMLQMQKNQIEEQIEKLRDKKQFKDKEIGEVFPDFAEDDDTKGV